MSKNVAVFVDVANIFYAAKAAGVDIDYITLLKAATAGRDFVRAYAYTGLDPENDNQRQFHAFLARNGYKVISKDIRKYGDGRIKANLDIELVVDMMKTARNLDIAVVVSGDGDFASAIRAVQEMGVRVEVISFRGNTSSDLIDVADLFTDIAQIARVDKSGRSGRRVAAEGDLSMTEVPEKETEGAPRRRRGGRPVREERPAVAARRPPSSMSTRSTARTSSCCPASACRAPVKRTASWPRKWTRKRPTPRRRTALSRRAKRPAAVAAGAVAVVAAVADGVPRTRVSPRPASRSRSKRKRSSRSCPRPSRRCTPSAPCGTTSWACPRRRRCRPPSIWAAAMSMRTRTSTSRKCPSTSSPSVASAASVHRHVVALAAPAAAGAAPTRPRSTASAMARVRRSPRTAQAAVTPAVAIAPRRTPTATAIGRATGRRRAAGRLRIADRVRPGRTTPSHARRRASRGRRFRLSSSRCCVRSSRASSLWPSR